MNVFEETGCKRSNWDKVGESMEGIISSAYPRVILILLISAWILPSSGFKISKRLFTTKNSIFSDFNMCCYNEYVFVLKNEKWFLDYQAFRLSQEIA